MSLANNSLTGFSTNSVSNHTGVLAVLHHQHVKVLNVGNGEVLESGRGDVLRLAVATITLVGHSLLALVAATNRGVLTAGLTPASAQLRKHFIAMTGELLRPLLHDRLRNDSLHHFRRTSVSSFFHNSIIDWLKKCGKKKKEIQRKNE